MLHPLTGRPPTQAFPESDKESSWVAVPTGWLVCPNGEFGGENKGVDWVCRNGAPVYAAHDGLLGWNDLTGATVTAPDGLETIYQHVIPALQQPGQKVNAGEVIGYVFDTSLKAKLHFEVHTLDEGPVNPTWWLHGCGEKLGVAESA